MARRPNYGAEKRQKELQRQAKKEEKAEKRRLKRESDGGDPEAVPVSEATGSEVAGAGGEPEGEVLGQG